MLIFSQDKKTKPPGGKGVEMDQEFNLRMERKRLVKAEANTYSASDHPCSRAAAANREAAQALEAFDLAHPEIKAMLEREEAERIARHNRQWDTPAGIEKQLGM